ncbi:hypothetical protein A4X09_0g6066 [Tilletia walkeri]|uniref:Uncharacterized protein n=1 Tax=Tilletia walkeri TaxID=117179 RepID=A0A8X7T2I9_9BASI|nr:hypothetical protein A4X09_0g6066 [Tilletia walkeri]
MRFALTASLSLLAFSALGFVTANPQQLASRQGPNTIYSDYPLQQTAAANITSWLVPITKAQASKLVGGRTLLPPKGLPAGFFLKKDQHLMLILAGYYSDVRQLNVISIPQMSFLHMYIPWVQAVANSQTPFLYAKGQKHYQTYLSQIIPALAGNLLQSANAKPAFFDPPHAAYKAIASDLSFNVDVGLLDNTIDGPGLTSPVFISTFRPSKSAAFSVEFMQSVMQQPFIRTDTKNTCTKKEFRYNETFADTFRVRGNLQTGADLTQSHLSFADAQGISGTAEWILPSEGSPCTYFA